MLNIELWVASSCRRLVTNISQRKKMLKASGDAQYKKTSLKISPDCPDQMMAILDDTE